MEEKKFMGDGDIPEIPDDIRLEVAFRYIQAYELITGEPFTPEDLDTRAEKERILSIIT